VTRLGSSREPWAKRRPPSGRYLTAEQARRVYDRIGRVQDLQVVYEHRATAELLAHADFEHANAVFELGYGTGALAARLLERYLPAESRYVGTDVSPQMQKLARRRVRDHRARAELHLGDGSLHFPFEDATFDRFVACYVLDLLSDEDIDLVLQEARRLLSPGGLLCLTSLTFGATAAARGVTRVWQKIWSVYPEVVGGCRPLHLADRLDRAVWATRHHAVVTAIGISSEVLIATRPDGTL
jgi:ubiquinone/menaquinone biosynthesis C-methylase UbiE